MYANIAENFVFYSAVENYPPKTKVLRRKKVINNLNVSNVSGYFACGSRSAIIQVPGTRSRHEPLPKVQSRESLIF